MGSISILAPSRERRVAERLWGVSNEYFNPRSLAGATVARAYSIFYFVNFNPRSLAGATAQRIYDGGGLATFNPRSLAGATILF